MPLITTVTIPHDNIMVRFLAKDKLAVTSAFVCFANHTRENFFCNVAIVLVALFGSDDLVWVVSIGSTQHAKFRQDALSEIHKMPLAGIAQLEAYHLASQRHCKPIKANNFAQWCKQCLTLVG